MCGRVESFAVLFIVVWLGLAALWGVALFDAGRRPNAQWAAVGRSRGAWLLLLVVTGWFGALYYVSVLRRQLRVREETHPRQPRDPRPKVPRRKEDWGDPWADA